MMVQAVVKNTSCDVFPSEALFPGRHNIYILASGPQSLTCVFLLAETAIDSKIR